ncbi:hypothetical protein TrRE_jg11079, partial [Triparma retinervis]
MAFVEATMKKSRALGNIVMAPTDMIIRRFVSKDKPLRVLVTMYNLQFLYTNAIENGLGFWVFYIIKEYFKRRGIPVVLF